MFIWTGYKLMYKKMLVPLDGSRLSEVVFPYAKDLAGRLGLDVTLFHVHSSKETETMPLHQAYIEYKAQLMKRQLQEWRRKLGVGAEGAKLQVCGELATGYPAEEIMCYVEENNIDLILMSTHGRSGVRRWVMGSVADRLLCVSSVPVWLVRASAAESVTYDKWPKKTLLVPLDGSVLAEKVLPHVEVLAKQPGTPPVDVLLLRVDEPPATSGQYFHNIPEEREDLEQYLSKIEGQLKNSGLRVQSEVGSGMSAEQILEYGRANPFTIIVMSTHGRSGMSRWFYGSVATKVLENACNPIFLIRPS
jgi:nucleotide-binding universal stress UspA family protein